MASTRRKRPKRKAGRQRYQPRDLRQLTHLLGIVSSLNHGYEIEPSEARLVASLLRRMLEGEDIRDDYLLAVNHRPAESHLLWVALHYRILKAKKVADAAATVGVAWGYGNQEDSGARLVRKIARDHRDQCDEILAVEHTAPAMERWLKDMERENEVWSKSQ